MIRINLTCFGWFQLCSFVCWSGKRRQGRWLQKAGATAKNWKRNPQETPLTALWILLGGLVRLGGNSKATTRGVRPKPRQAKSTGQNKLVVRAPRLACERWSDDRFLHQCCTTISTCYQASISTTTSSSPWYYLLITLTNCFWQDQDVKAKNRLISSLLYRPSGIWREPSISCQNLINRKFRLT